MIHQSYIENYKGNLKDLTVDIGNLRYDALADFLRLLAEKLEYDATQDQARGRVKLAASLQACSEKLQASSLDIDHAWKMSEPYMQ